VSNPRHAKYPRRLRERRNGGETCRHFLAALSGCRHDRTARPGETREAHTADLWKKWNGTASQICRGQFVRGLWPAIRLTAQAGRSANDSPVSEGQRARVTPGPDVHGLRDGQAMIRKCGEEDESFSATERPTEPVGLRHDESEAYLLRLRITTRGEV